MAAVRSFSWFFVGTRLYFFTSNKKTSYFLIKVPVISGNTFPPKKKSGKQLCGSQVQEGVTSRNSSYSIIGKTGFSSVEPRPGKMVPIFSLRINSKKNALKIYSGYSLGINIPFKKRLKMGGFSTARVDHHPQTWVSLETPGRTWAVFMA